MPTTTLYFILIFLLLQQILSVDFSTLRKRHAYKYSLKRPYFYLQDNQTIPFYDYYGSVIVSDYYIRIAPSVPNMKGSVWSKQKNSMKDWMVEFSINIAGRGAIGGNGLVFWYTKEQGVPLSLQLQPKTDPHGISLGPYGSTEKWEGVGVFFDTYDEVNHLRNMPYIFAINNDMSKDIKELNVQNNPSEHQIGGCFYNYRNLNQVFGVRLVYVNGKFEVYVDRSTNGKTFELCFSVDVPNLPPDYYFGLSAESGIYADDHDVISIDVYEVYTDATANKEKEEPKLDPKDEKMFEEIRGKVDHIREDEERRALFHDPETVVAQNSIQHNENLSELKEMQVKILDNIHELVIRSDKFSNAANTGGNSGNTNAGVSEMLQIAKDINVKLTAVSGDLKIVKNELDALKGLLGQVKDSQEDVKRLIVKQHAESLNNKNDQKSQQENRDNSHSTSSSDNNMWGWYIGGFVLSQFVLLYLYKAWRNTGREQSKKFI